MWLKLSMSNVKYDRYFWKQIIRTLGTNLFDILGLHHNYENIDIFLNATLFNKSEK